MVKKLFVLLSAAVIVMSCGQEKTTLTKSGLDPESFVAERDGAKTILHTLTNEAGMEVCVTNFGGRIVSVMVPDRNGDFKDVVLGFDNINDYFPENNQTDFGATIGRYANRIAQGKITVEGVEYQLPQNNYGHCLHGGPDGWQYKVFDVVEADPSHIKLKVVSPDGDANFPGTVTAFVTFTLTEDNAIDIDYEATTDKTTVINMTNHSYFNLAGDPAGHSIVDDELYINATCFTPVDSTFMTTGEIVPVEGTPMDFRTAKLVGRDIEADYDLCRQLPRRYRHRKEGSDLRVPPCDLPRDPEVSGYAQQARVAFSPSPSRRDLSQPLHLRFLDEVREAAHKDKAISC